uniref:Uncharacterized protein n=1 Tax=Globisporangium ultimum (strain ATCC 200006 / CBS 805.95 / DAOM BR144) TaxID=431595 RepID=K3WYQ3_GLOUD
MHRTLDGTMPAWLCGCETLCVHENVGYAQCKTRPLRINSRAAYYICAYYAGIDRKAVSTFC